MSLLDAGFIPLLEGCRQLASLEIQGISSLALDELENLPKMEDLLIMTSKLADRNLAMIASMTTLNAISLYNCKGLQTLINLEKLSLVPVFLLNDKVVTALIDHLPNLADLILMSFEGERSCISNESLFNIGAAISQNRLKKLTYLKVKSPRITVELVNQLALTFPKMMVENK